MSGEIDMERTMREAGKKVVVTDPVRQSQGKGPLEGEVLAYDKDGTVHVKVEKRSPDGSGWYEGHEAVKKPTILKQEGEDWRP